MHKCQEQVAPPYVGVQGTMRPQPIEAFLVGKPSVLPIPSVQQRYVHCANVFHLLVSLTHIQLHQQVDQQVGKEHLLASPAGTQLLVPLVAISH